MQAALEVGDEERAESLLGVVEEQPPGRRTPLLTAQAGRFGALLAARRGNEAEAERLFKRSVGLLRELAMPFQLAVVLLEEAESLGPRSQGDEADALAAEALALFEGLGAAPWIGRASRLVCGDAVLSAVPATVSVVRGEQVL